MPQGPVISTIHSMADVWDAYRDELEGVEDRVRKNLDSSVTLVNTVAAHILNSGGKRIRPLLLLLSARLCGYTGHGRTINSAAWSNSSTPPPCCTTMSWTMPTSAEAAEPRAKSGEIRSASWSATISIRRPCAKSSNSGTRASTKSWPKPAGKWRKGKSFNSITTGTRSMPEAEYLEIVEHKTAGLIAASCRIGAILADAIRGRNSRRCSASANISASPFKWPTIPWITPPTASRSGKTMGQDLRQGKATLPLLHLLQHCSGAGPADDQGSDGNSDAERRRSWPHYSPDGRLRVDHLCAWIAQSAYIAAAKR